jgi:hypothetical protein
MQPESFIVHPKGAYKITAFGDKSNTKEYALLEGQKI